MRKIDPYKTLRGASRALDNGGRFYNLFTQAQDRQVEPAELARAAGVFSSDAQAMIFFDMAIADLGPGEKAELVSTLSTELRERYRRQRPVVLAPSAVEAEGEQGQAVITAGYPVFLEDRSEFAGMVVMVTPVITLIPIMDQYDVYELYESAALNGRPTVIATARGSTRLESGPVRLGGMLKELKFDDKTGKEHGLFLETLYFTPL